ISTATVTAAAVTAAVISTATVTAAAIPAAITVTAIAIAAFAGIGLGYDRTADGEMKRRDNQRQRSERLQDKPAAHARYAHPILPIPAIQPFGQTTPPAMSQH
ncbi:hypothetical protein, partial [Mesorhizobium sp. M1E.F.Ca.ET.063.01.1.1]|uniref:hypothetical protein n=1 Tax=Mesorhizobium sp. M1E.F.Ca.ET.063.01.1.1 TaxID=2496750 RepID=UPI00167A47B6